MPDTRRRNKTQKSTKLKETKESVITKQPSKNDNVEMLARKDVWTPGSYLAFKALLSARFCSAIWGIINDCDETYNYWEPTNYLLTGTGFQTWEYSPTYALRSYAYLVIHAVPAFIYEKIFQPNHILTFFFIRCIAALCCSLCELYFYKGVCKKFGANVGRIYLCTSVFAAGMFISASAYLPSSFAMYMTLISYGGWFDDNYPVAIYGTALSTFLGWPFAVLTGVPIAVDILFIRKQYVTFFKWSLLTGSIIVLSMFMVDSIFYGKLTFAPMNLVLYNVFSSHGPNLYGTEPFYFYFLNCFLNFNISVIVIVVGLPIIGVLMLFPSFNFMRLNAANRTPLLLYLSGLVLWFVVFMLQPHKEERFIFPMYPILILTASFVVDYSQRVLFRLIGDLKNNSYLHGTNWVGIVFVCVTSIIGVSRIVGQYQAYHAPFSIFLELNRLEAEGRIPNLRAVNLCLGREWHRYPSSFFLPADNWNVLFIESEFRGQLPQPFEKINGTQIIPTKMNDLNLEEVSRYSPISTCHFIVDVDRPEETEREPRYSLKKTQWNVLYSVPFLENHKSHVLFRAIYVPFLTEKYCEYVDYVILQSTKLKLIESLS